MPNGIDYFVQQTVMKGASFKPTTVELPMRRGALGPDDLIAQAVANDAGAIGFGAFGSVIPGMKTIPVAFDARGTYYSGTRDEVQSLRYPLARPIYLVIDRAPGQPIAPTLNEFIHYVLSEQGQRAVSASDGWLPLPAARVSGELRKLE